MKHYLFMDDESGEEFLVGAYNAETAKDIARNNFGDYVKIICIMSDTEAEMSGLDEY